MRKYFLLFFSIFFLSSCSFFTASTPEQTDVPEEEEVAEVSPTPFEPEAKVKVYVLKGLPGANSGSIDDFLVPVEIGMPGNYEKLNDRARTAISILLDFRKPETDIKGTYTGLFLSQLRLANILELSDKVLVSFEGDYKVVGNYINYAPKQIEKTIALYYPKYEITLNGSASNWLCITQIDKTACKE